MANSRKTKAETTPTGAAETERTLVPALDVLETANEFLVVADMPGADESTTSVVVARDRLTIEGRWAVAFPSGYTPVRTEFEPRNYQCVLGVTEKIDRENAKAEFKEGVLTVSLPKAHGTMPRKVPIVAG